MVSKKFANTVTFLLVVGFVASLAVAQMFASEKYQLSYRMVKGQKLEYKMSMNFEQTMEMQGREMTQGSTGMVLTSIEIEEVSKNGDFTLIHSMDSLKIHLHTPQFDTTLANPPELIGKRTRTVMSAAGKKIKSAEIDTVAISGFLAQTGASRQSILRLVELPEKEVGIGDSWSHTSQDTIDQGMIKIYTDASMQYTASTLVDTLGYKCLRIAYLGTTKIKGEGKQMGMNFFVEGEGPSSGVAYFAPKEGQLVAVLSTTDLDATVALTGQMSMTIPQTTTTKMSMVLVK